MKLPGGMDLNAMMQQAREMQEQMGREMKEMTASGRIRNVLHEPQVGAELQRVLTEDVRHVVRHLVDRSRR